MGADQLRKKWGTIFMGERESTMEQLDAMYEPMRQERARQEQEEDYLERVRAKAADKARLILGEAYAERQKVLEEARAEAAAIRQAAVAEVKSVAAAAAAMKEEAEAARAQAQEEHDAAVRIREAAHGEGFQAGMEQAGQELLEFRAELGQSLGALLHALESQMEGICAAWREDLADLLCAAVAAGTGWVLQSEHEKILRSLLMESLKLLEERISVVVRVHPDDEASVSDMFLAARERMPELKQWIVNGDPSMQRGGLVLESGSGSVDCRRELFQELVSSVLSHLGLSSCAEEQLAVPVSAIVEREAARIAALAAPPQPASLYAPQKETPGEAVPAPEAEEADTPPENEAPVLQEHGAALPEETAGQPLTEDAVQQEAEEVQPAAVQEAPVPVPDDIPVPEAWLPPLGEEDSLQNAEDDLPAALEGKADPSMAELEEELFPLNADGRDNVFVDGGFLPAADTGRSGNDK